MYEHMKLPDGSDLRPQVTLLNPTSGALLRGNVLLIAGVSANCSIKAVNFAIAGSGDPHQVLHAERFQYGWFRYWSTTDVSNGLYTVQSTACDIGGYAQHPACSRHRSELIGKFKVKVWHRPPTGVGVRHPMRPQASLPRPDGTGAWCTTATCIASPWYPRDPVRSAGSAFSSGVSITVKN